jgi:hypothetical protein
MARARPALVPVRQVLPLEEPVLWEPPVPALPARPRVPRPALVFRSSLFGDLLLTCDRHTLALAGPCVGMGALATYRETPTVTKTLVATDLDLPLDVLCDIASKIAFDLEVAVDELSDLENLGIGEVPDLGVRVDFE